MYVFEGIFVILNEKYLFQCLNVNYPNVQDLFKCHSYNLCDHKCPHISPFKILNQSLCHYKALNGSVSVPQLGQSDSGPDSLAGDP